MKTDWQREQAERCPCQGSDDYCPCQNVRFAATKVPDTGCGSCQYLTEQNAELQRKVLILERQNKLLKHEIYEQQEMLSVPRRAAEIAHSLANLDDAIKAALGASK